MKLVCSLTLSLVLGLVAVTTLNAATITNATIDLDAVPATITYKSLSDDFGAIEGQLFQLIAGTPIALTIVTWDTDLVVAELASSLPGDYLTAVLPDGEPLALFTLTIPDPDADTLDGLDSSELAASLHTHTGEEIDSGTVAEAFLDEAVARDAEIFPGVLAQDGPGSGLDADTLDGLDSSDFLTVVSDVWVDEAGDTMTGTLALSPGAGSALEANGDIDLVSGDVLKNGTLFLHDTGTANTALGSEALLSITTGSANTAVGEDALRNNTTGSGNIAIGSNTGGNLTIGDDNIHIGNDGIAGETATIKVGIQGTQSQTFIAGIHGASVAGSPVVVDSAGQLGVGSVDADTLDGLDSTELAAALHTHAGDEIDSGTVGEAFLDEAIARDAEIFPEVLAQDGPDSGLDADTLDGLDSTAFLTEVTDTWVDEAGDTMTGDLDLSGANLLKDGTLFLHDNGSDNTALGHEALLLNTTGSRNTAVGEQALRENTSGFGNTAVGEGSLGSSTTGLNNTAVGESALQDNTSGNSNIAVGEEALRQNTVGDDNTAVGEDALRFNITGDRNTAVGKDALESVTTGSNNIAVGFDAGSGVMTGSNNILIGSTSGGSALGHIEIGTEGTQEKTFIAGIRGVTTDVDDAVAVMIDSAGQLGTVSSTRRVKEQIEEMGEVSDRLLELRPVTFRFKKAFEDGDKPLQYGLIAEEVAAVFPELAVYDEEGRPATVKYHLLSALLLNELQKQSEQIEEQRQELLALQARLAKQESQQGELLAAQRELFNQRRDLQSLAARLERLEAETESPRLARAP